MQILRAETLRSTGKGTEIRREKTRTSVSRCMLRTHSCSRPANLRRGATLWSPSMLVSLLLFKRIEVVTESAHSYCEPVLCAEAALWRLTGRLLPGARGIFFFFRGSLLRISTRWTAAAAAAAEAEYNRSRGSKWKQTEAFKGFETSTKLTKWMEQMQQPKWKKQQWQCSSGSSGSGVRRQ
eukprot:SAG11_NODE_51_length_19848_cov_37.780698_10_plen_181_part_00